MKNWILNLSFVKSALKEAERQGGIKAFPLAQKDVLETMRDDLDQQAEELAKKKLNDLLSVVDMNAVVTLNKQAGAIYVGGERVDEGRLGNLKAEADFFAQSDLWKLIYESPKELAQRAMFVAGESLTDMQKGRAMLYTLSSQKNIIDIFASFKPKPRVDTTTTSGV